MPTQGYNEYMREYMKERYHRRRAEAIEKMGGACSRCGSSDDLTFDHVDRDSKVQAIGKILAGGSDERVARELAKCQLLCLDCHKRKTKENHEGFIHGSPSLVCRKGCILVW